jgi:NTP pyrophosphatase (non-canonical NTP hydrolase)
MREKIHVEEIGELMKKAEDTEARFLDLKAEKEEVEDVLAAEITKLRNAQKKSLEKLMDEQEANMQLRDDMAKQKKQAYVLRDDWIG